MATQDITDFDHAALRLRLAIWLAAGGTEELADAMAAAERTRHEIRKALRPDPDSMRMPMTI